MPVKPTYEQLEHRIEELTAKVAVTGDGEEGLQKAYGELVRLMDEKTLELARENDEIRTRISEIQRSNESNERESTLNRTLLDAFPCVALLLDADYKILAANRVGQVAGAVPGMLCFDTWGQRDTPCPWCLAPKALGSNQEQNCEIELNGMLWDVTWIPLHDDLFLYYAFDITEKKRLQAVQQHTEKLSALGALTRHVSNDFNSILTGIQGRTSIMLRDMDTSHAGYEHLRKIEEYADNAGNLTNQLLEFAMAGNRRMRPVDVNSTVQGSVKTFESASEAHVVQPEYGEDIWPVEMDDQAVGRALGCILECAWQAMPGGGELYLQTENVTLDRDYVKPHGVAPGSYVKVSVADSGVGINETVREKIFDPFFIAKEMGWELGLGLSSAYGIIRSHGGWIDISSIIMEGTTYNIYLPTRESSLSDKTGSGMPRGTVLLVDDKHIMVEVGDQMLVDMGYTCLAAQSGQEAIEIYKEHLGRIDLVLLDMILPGMGGEKIFDSLKKIDPRVRVLLTSGYGITDEVKELLSRGCSGYVQKPFNLPILSREIDRIMEA